uniref:FG-GAP repeat domain-containing protein n=1 Tax=Phaeodactylibacter xiamenensis TaxID=1524460 RepID=UPI0024A944F7
MKRLFTIVLSTIIVTGLFAQGFTELNTMLEAVSESSVAFADVDGDMDQDVLITGESQAGGRVAKLYKNDGAGQYTEVSTPFLGVVNGSSAFADVDGDMDQDVLITGGILNQQLPFAQLYTNDGSGTFTALTTPIIGVADGAVAFADIDGDMDQDVIVTGRLSDFTQVAKLYVNNGSNQFSEVTTPFTGVRSGSVNFADVDGDMDQDLMITGQTSSGSVASLYINDGNGQFTESSNTFPGVRFSSVAFADVDGDADQDLLLTGLTTNF